MEIEINRVIIEELLVDPSTDDFVDYLFFCIRGKHFYVQLDSNRQGDHYHYYYDTERNSLDVLCTYPEGSHVEKPRTIKKDVGCDRHALKRFPF